MNYKELFKNLKIENLDFRFFMSEKQIAQIKEKDNDFINNLAFSPVVKKSKEKIFKKLFTQTITDSEKKFLLEKIYKYYDDFYLRFNNKRILIREFVRYLFDWIEINGYQIEVIKDNIIKIDNKILVFYIVHRFYNENLYNETVILINQLFSKNYFTKKDELYNDLLLYKLYSLKQDHCEYLNNKKTFQEICKIAQNLYGFEYIRIITLLECKLNEKDVIKFKEILKKHIDKIKEWEIYEILNLYELSIYIKDEEVIEQIEKILKSKDIEIFLDDEDYLIFDFLQAVKVGDNDKIEKYKNKLADKYDFSHFEKFYNKSI